VQISGVWHPRLRLISHTVLDLRWHRLTFSLSSLSHLEFGLQPQPDRLAIPFPRFQLANEPLDVRSQPLLFDHSPSSDAVSLTKGVVVPLLPPSCNRVPSRASLPFRRYRKITDCSHCL
jgi:hypothetical protein